MSGLVGLLRRIWWERCVDRCAERERWGAEGFMVCLFACV